MRARGRATRRRARVALALACGTLALLGRAEGAKRPARGASSCVTLNERDAVVAVCLQNDFMDEREADGSYARSTGAATANAPDIPASATTEGGRLLRRGSLAVKNGQEVVSVANEWLAMGSSSGSRVMVTFDRHPEAHCSFCTFGADGKQMLDCVWGCEGLQGLCVSGSSVPKEVFDSSNRCLDDVSSNDYAQSRYFQWPPHCVEGTFGAELDPFLHVPSGTRKLKTSFARDRDSYSMFHASDSLTGETMEDILRDEDIDRVFIMGLATDMVVKNTLWDILKSQNNTQKQAILVAAGVRGVFDEPGDYYLSSPKSGSGVVKAEAIARGARIVAAANVYDALGELCDGTCDDDMDCDGEMICDVSAQPFGRCKARPMSNGIATAMTIIAILGALIVFRKDIIESYNNRHKARGPPTDFVVLVETDIEGSSELWEKMGELGKGEIMKNVIMKLHDECLRQSMKKHFGYELLVRGDAFLVAFHSVTDALSWALQVQLDLMNASWPEDCHNVTKATMQEFGKFNGLRVRMGIHCGKVDKCLKHHGKIVYEGAVLKQTTNVADAGFGGAIILSQSTLPLSSNVDIPYVLFDQGLHEMNAFQAPQRLKEVYPEELASRIEVRAAMDTVQRLTPSFHEAPEGEVTMCYAHVVGLHELQKSFGVKILEKGLSVMFETLRMVMMRAHCRGYDCRGYERNGENMYVFSTYRQGLLFALEAQVALQQAEWPEELSECNGSSMIRGLPVRMGMHSGPLKRIRIPTEGLADYYGEAANRAARVMSVAVGGQVVCVEFELERALQQDSEGLPDIFIDHLGAFSLKGIPGVTSLVQVALTAELAKSAGARYTAGKKAQLVHPASAETRVYRGSAKTP